MSVSIGEGIASVGMWLGIALCVASVAYCEVESRKAEAEVEKAKIESHEPE